MSSEPAPVSAEATTLTAIEAEKAKISAYIQTTPHEATPATFGTWLGGIDDFAWQLIQLTPVTEWLAQQGRPAAKQKLLTETVGLAGARQKHVETYRAAAGESGGHPTLHPANKFAIENIERSSRYRQAVEHAWVQRSFDINERSCFGCGKDIEIPGGGYCLDCARHRGMISAFEG